MKLEEPVRLLEDAQDSLLRTALEAGRAELPEAARLAAIQAKVAAAAAAGAAGAAVATGLSGTAKVVGVVLAVGAAVGGGVAIRAQLAPTPEPTVLSSQEGTIQRPPAAPPDPAPAPAEPDGVAAAVEPAPSPSRPIIPIPAARRRDRADPAMTMDPKAEAALLQQAKDALLAEPGRALQLCEAHARRFAAGVLGQEREVIAIEALVGMGQLEQARERARRFRDSHPGSTHLRRIDQVLGQ